MFRSGTSRAEKKEQSRFIKATKQRIKLIRRAADKSGNRAVRRTVRLLYARWETLLKRLTSEQLLLPILLRYFERYLPVIENMMRNLPQLVPSPTESHTAAETRARLEATLEDLLDDLARLCEQVDKRAFGDIHAEMDVLEAQFKLER